jgi:hypothetical protein
MRKNTANPTENSMEYVMLRKDIFSLNSLLISADRIFTAPMGERSII